MEVGRDSSKRIYKAAFIVRRACALKRRYEKHLPWKTMSGATVIVPGYSVALNWIDRAMRFLRNNGMWEEAEDLRLILMDLGYTEKIAPLGSNAHYL